LAKHRVLVVDNEVGMLEVCGDILKKLPDVETVLESRSVKAADLVRDEAWDLLITDLRMPGLTGIELIRIARQHDAGIVALIITAFPSVDTAVEGMKLGAADYIVKPFKPDDLLATVRRMLETKRLREEHTLLQRQIERPYSFGEMIGRSSAMREVFETVEQVADTNADVLITGATGTGKELVARSVHQHSRRSNKRFVPVDCGAIPEDLLESEFFGHERGAFTGANSRSLGLMEFAHEGTLFLDEIGELPLRLQAKLLRALQERRIRRVGGNAEIDVDVRIVAATARDLESEIKVGRFRADLFYRINVVRIKLPALRGRHEDIPLLIDHFLGKYAKEMNREGATLDQEAIDVLTGYDWPGNIRELQNVVKRILATARTDLIEVRDLPDELVAGAIRGVDRGSASFFELRERQVAAFEEDYFRSLLRMHQGDVTRAAAEAEVPRGTLYRLLTKHGLTPSDFRGTPSNTPD
jgi:DNA-binding NtrC family response regulator